MQVEHTYWKNGKGPRRGSFLDGNERKEGVGYDDTSTDETS